MARPRRRMSEWTRKRDAMARAKGYRSYQSYRNEFDSGRIAPTEKPIPRGQRQEARGHAGEIRRFTRSLREGDLILCDVTAVERDSRGRYFGIEKLVIPADLGEQREFRIENITRARLVRLIDDEHSAGVIFSPQPSLDQQRLVSATEAEGGY